jgi:hypothetical protein
MAAMRATTATMRCLLQIAMLLHYAAVSAESLPALGRDLSRAKPAAPKVAADARDLLPRVIKLIAATGADGAEFAGVPRSPPL